MEKIMKLVLMGKLQEARNHFFKIRKTLSNEKAREISIALAKFDTDEVDARHSISKACKI